MYFLQEVFTHCEMQLQSSGVPKDQTKLIPCIVGWKCLLLLAQFKWLKLLAQLENY